MKRLYVTTALVTLLAAGPAFAQQNAPDKAQPPEAGQQQEMMKDSDKSKEQAGTTNTGSIEFVSAQKENDWLASSLIGRGVENASGDSLGKINDVLLDENGDVVAVLIGVGGFLGIGGKDVAVNYDALEFKKREIKRPATTGADARQRAADQATRPPGAGAGQNPLLQQNRQATPPAPRKDADHSDMVIVLNTNKEQLESAPAFTRLGETAQQSESEPADKDAKMKQEQPKQQ